MRRAISPESTASCSVRAQTFVVTHRVLNDEGLHPLGMRQGHSEADWAAVILHVKRVPSKSNCLCEVAHDEQCGRRCSRTASDRASRCARNRDSQARSNDSRLPAVREVAETCAMTMA